MVGHARSLRLHRYACFVVLFVILLIFFGGQVKSTNSGLSVPDWPNTYGHFMFSFPWDKMVGGIFWEHSHRMIASVAGLLTFGLTIWVYRVETRQSVRTLSLLCSFAVLLQGLLGGLTVIHMLPAWISTAHGTLAQTYLCLVAAVAILTSRRWMESAELERSSDTGSPGLRRIVLATTVTVFLQLVIGAVMRHTESGLAIPDFPTMFGSWVPPLSDERLAAANQELWRMNLLWSMGNSEITRGQMIVHLLHRVGAVAVTVMAVWTAVRVFRDRRDDSWLTRPAVLLCVLVTIQATLGILTILTEKQVEITTLHVLTGALTLLTSFTLTLRARRRLAPAAVGARRRYASGPIPEEVAV